MQRAPRQWCLTKTETVNTFENWRHNLVYTLSLDPNFAQFIASDAKWEKRCAAHPNRGFTDDIDLASGRTDIQQTYMLDLMLGQIANFCPVISRNTIAKNALQVYLAFGKRSVCITDFNLQGPISWILLTYTCRPTNVPKTCISA